MFRADDAPQLRFDKVVVRVAERLRAGVGPSVPRGRVVIITVTAPIRQAAKTAAALEQRLRARLASSPSRRVVRLTICGNRIGVGIESAPRALASPVVLFVHNPGTDARVLLAMTRAWASWLRRHGRRTAAKDMSHRSPCAYSPGAMDAYRHLASTLGPTTTGGTLSIVFADGRKERLEV